MAKRVKTKKGSIGKKALAAILAASMVLSSSAFSVLAASSVEPIDKPMTIALSAAFDRKIESANVKINKQTWAGPDSNELKANSVSVWVSGDSSEANLREWDESNPQEGWTYIVEKVCGGNVATYTDNTQSWTQIVDPEDGLKCPWNLDANHVHIKLHWYSSTDQPAPADGAKDGSYLIEEYEVEALNLETEDSIEVNWGSPKTFKYDGTYQHSAVEKIHVNPRGTAKGFDLDLNEFEVIPVDSNGAQTNVDKEWNQYESATYPDVAGRTEKDDGVHYIAAALKDNSDYAGNIIGNTAAQEIAIEQASWRADPGLIGIDVKPVSAQKNTPDMIEAIEAATSVRDVVLMDGNKVVGKNLVNDVDYGIIFPNESGDYVKQNNAWVQNVPSMEPGDHPFRVYVKNSRNFLTDTYKDATYTVKAANDLELIARNGELPSEFKDNDKDGEYELVYDTEDHYPWTADKKGTQLKLRENAKVLKEGTDYKIESVRTWRNAGTYTLEIIGKGDYKGQTAEIKVNILPKPLWMTGKDGKLDTGDFTAELDQSIRGDGKYGDVFPTIEWATGKAASGYEKLTLGTDYNVEYVDNGANNLLGTAVITGKGNYTTEWKNGSKSGDEITIVNSEDKDDGKIDFHIESNVTDLRDSCISASIGRIYQWDDAVKESLTIQESDITVTDSSASNPILKLGEEYEIFAAETGGSALPVKGGAVEIPNVKVGTNTIYIRGKVAPAAGSAQKGYCSTHSCPVTFTVVGEDFTAAYVADDIPDIPYTGSPITKPQPKVHRAGESHSYDAVDYTYYYADGVTEVKDDNGNPGDITEIGTYVVKIKSTDKSFEGEITKEFKVVGADINTVATAEVVSGSSVVYNGSEQVPEVNVTLNDRDKTPLYVNIDYTIKGATDAGEAVAVITGISDYSGTIEVPFTITPASIEGATVTAENQEYSDNPAVTVVVDGRTLVQGTDYTVTAVKSEDGKTATVTVTGTGNYTGTATQTATFEIVESGSDEPEPTPPVEETIKTPTITLSNKISKTKKTFTVTSCKVAGATQWKVQYSLKNTLKANGDLKGCKTRTITKANRLYRQKITCNKSGKRYYVRVSAYVPDKGWSEWSDTVEGLEQIKSR